MPLWNVLQDVLNEPQVDAAVRIKMGKMRQVYAQHTCAKISSGRMCKAVRIWLTLGKEAKKQE